MHKIGDKGATYASLPPNMQSESAWAFGAALDRQTKKLMAFSRCVRIWPEIESLNPKYLDYVAATLRALYYASEHDVGTKITILKNALSTYRYAGTTKAVEELLASVFKDAQLVPWYEYDGIPYHFKVVTPTEESEEAIKNFSEILRKVKAARSIIDGIETKTYFYDIKAYIANYGAFEYEKMEEMVND